VERLKTAEGRGDIQENGGLHPPYGSGTASEKEAVPSPSGRGAEVRDRAPNIQRELANYLFPGKRAMLPKN
jgi:hypothetical protein